MKKQSLAQGKDQMFGHTVDIPSPGNQEPSELRLADFDNLSEALDYAALSDAGMNFYNARGVCEHRLTYKAIRQRALIMANRLVGAGLERGERVGIVANMHPDFICSFFACQYAGLLAVPLPVITGLGGAEDYETMLHSVLENSQARLVLGPTSLMDNLSRATEGTSVEIKTTASALIELPAADVTLAPLQGDEVSHIQFSSGSTRMPIGIEINQSASLANARSIAQDALSFTAADRVASWLPFYHDMGLVGCVLVPLTCQLNVDYLYPDSFARNPVQWLRLISDNQSTISFSPTFGYEICSRRMKGKGYDDLDLSSWRVAGIGGDMIQSDVMDNFAQIFAPCGFHAKSFVPSYGLAEATLAFSFQPLGKGVTFDYLDKEALSKDGVAIPAYEALDDKSLVRTIASCGKALAGYDVSIRDTDGNVLKDRSVGRVFISGPSLMNGYYRNENATSACLDSTGWLDTGDMGYLVDGDLYITGRSKDMIIVNGKNIWPQDIEWYVEANVEQVRKRDTAAFGSVDTDGNEKAVLLVQCRRSDINYREQLKKDVKNAVFKNCGLNCDVILIPQRSLPFTTSGKLSRAKAKKLWKEGAFERESEQNVVIA